MRLIKRFLSWICHAHLALAYKDAVSVLRSKLDTIGDELLGGGKGGLEFSSPDTIRLLFTHYRVDFHNRGFRAATAFVERLIADAKGITADELAVLDRMSYDTAYTFSHLGRMVGNAEKDVREIVRALFRRGLVDFGTLHSDELLGGGLRGRGYWLSDDGRKALDAAKALRDFLASKPRAQSVGIASTGGELGAKPPAPRQSALATA